MPNPSRRRELPCPRSSLQPTFAADANVVIVEGVLDALAIAATAARTGEMARFAPCATSGVSASQEQVCRVLALHPQPPVTAMDADEAGAEGTNRWLAGLRLDGELPALVTTLPQETTQLNGLPSKETQACQRSTDEVA